MIVARSFSIRECQGHFGVAKAAGGGYSPFYELGNNRKTKMLPHHIVSGASAVGEAFGNEYYGYMY